MRIHVFARLAQNNLARRHICRRYSKNAGDTTNQSRGSTNAEFMNDASLDPRPPWLYNYSTLLRVLVVPGELLLLLSVCSFFLTKNYPYPAGFIYAVFFHDFGKQEHVFMPVCKELTPKPNL